MDKYEKYELIDVLGEGSFGRVFKAKQIADSTIIALKTISKRGKSLKELKGLRRECEIQRHLHHPNIIQMLDSFETENEIVVITEFAHKELCEILGQSGCLAEERVQKIVWDLVSALNYLHSHRVLHRDLKPQNILLDLENRAKLCDFGFARNMSTGTHVLTSIKGTPLYMAPELIEEHPYDHSADLWSLGCIIYELLVGTPPFCTTSILHLIKLIRHEQIQWPTLISDDCMSFLKGLLQKNPAKRLTWPEILNHRFVKGHILITEDIPTMPLTRPMSLNTLNAKERQTKDHLSQKAKAGKGMESTMYGAEPVKTVTSHLTNLLIDEASCNASSGSNCKKALKDTSKTYSHDKTNLSESGENKSQQNSLDKLLEKNEEIRSNLSGASTTTQEQKFPTLECINFQEESQPIESEEWIVFLQRSVEEVMNGEMTSLTTPNLANIIVSPLRNSNSSSKVLVYVTSLFSLPFIVPGVPKETLAQIRKVYLEIKLVPNLVYATKLLLKSKDTNGTTMCSPINGPTNSQDSLKPIADLSQEDLQALEYIFLIICHLVYVDVQYLSQFCDSVVILNIYVMLKHLLQLAKRKIRVVTDLVAIFTLILRTLPENCEVVEAILTDHNSDNENSVDFIHMLRHSSALLRERTCYLLQHMAKTSKRPLETIWNNQMRETLEALVFDSVETVRNAAETTVDEMKNLDFYCKLSNIDSLQNNQ